MIRETLSRMLNLSNPATRAAWAKRRAGIGSNAPRREYPGIDTHAEAEAEDKCDRIKELNHAEKLLLSSLR